VDLCFDLGFEKQMAGRFLLSNPIRVRLAIKEKKAIKIVISIIMASTKTQTSTEGWQGAVGPTPRA
jgi:hypothetical protein